MGYRLRINRAYQNALHLPLGMDSRYVIFSDCHRGNGKANDNFIKNEFLYVAALNYYFNREFTYIELGDGDELWENRSINSIKNMHQQSFDILSKYFESNRFYAIYGNHDIVKKHSNFADSYFCSCYLDHKMSMQSLFPNITFYPGIILESENGEDIFLTHGHQADILNSTFWRLSRFLVRYVWRPLEYLGIPDPTSAAKNNTRKNAVEKRLVNWAKEEQQILIAGHTHRPMMGTSNSPYYNTGSCVSPYGITCIEINRGCISLIKWFLNTNAEQAVYVEKTELAKKVCRTK